MTAFKLAEEREINQKLGGRVRDARKRCRWTQAQLAAKLDMSQHNWSRYERGEYGLSVYQLAQLSVIFAITIESWFVPDEWWQNCLAQL